MSELNEIYEHLTEIRKRVLRIVIVVGVITVFLMAFHFEPIVYNEFTLYYPTPKPLDNIAAQITDYFSINLVPDNVQLIQTAPGQAFFSQVYICYWLCVCLFICHTIYVRILIQIWRICWACNIFEYNGFCYICITVSLSVWNIIPITANNVCCWPIWIS